MSTWYTVEEAQEEWPDPSSGALLEMLDVAKAQVLAYAPSRIVADIAATGEVPDNYRLAQFRQAKNLWRADSANSQGDMSEGEFSYTPHPLDWHVKQLIRPRRGRPSVG